MPAKSLPEIMAADANSAKLVILEQIAGCVLWLDADDPSTVDQSTASPDVDNWIDKSGAGVITALSQATAAAKPHRVAGAINGRTALLFDDAASQYLEVGTAAFATAPFTMLAVAQSDDDATSGQSIFWVGDKDANSEYWSWECDGGKVGDPLSYEVFGFSQDGSGNGGVDTTSGYTSSQAFVLSAVEESGSSRSIRVNGSSLGTSSTQKRPSGADRTSVGRVGSASPGGHFSGYICEILVFDKALSGAQRRLCEAYLAEKWGVTLAA